MFGRACVGIYQSERNKESAAHSIRKWASTVGRERVHASSTAVQQRSSTDASSATTRTDDARAATTTTRLWGSSNTNAAATTSRWFATNAGMPRSTASVGKPRPRDGDAATGHATSSTIQTQPSRFAHASPFAWVLKSLHFIFFIYF
jgi:hypothetical protein